MTRGSNNLNSETLLSIAEGLDLVLISNDEVLVQFGTRTRPSELLRDTDLKGIVGQVIGRLLQCPTAFGELLTCLPAEDRDEAHLLVEDLVERGILTDANTNPVAQYLGYTFSGESSLESRRVSLIGAGPVGARLAHSLLQHGLGRLTLLDDRKTNRLWHTFQPLGPQLADGDERPASHVLKDGLSAAGHTGVEALKASLDTEGVGAAVAAADFIVVALEQPHLRLVHLVNRFCLRDRKPWMLALIDGNWGIVGPLFLPAHTACFNDYRVLADAATPSPGMARQHRQHILQRDGASFFPGLPAYAEIVAGYTSLAVVHYLLRDTSFALGRALVIDFDRMLIDVEDVLKLPRCPVCGTVKSAYKSPFSAEVVAQSAGGSDQSGSDGGEM